MTFQWCWFNFSRSDVEDGRGGGVEVLCVWARQKKETKTIKLVVGLVNKIERGELMSVTKHIISLRALRYCECKRLKSLSSSIH